MDVGEHEGGGLLVFAGKIRIDLPSNVRRRATGPGTKVDKRILR